MKKLILLPFVAMACAYAGTDPKVIIADDVANFERELVDNAQDTVVDATVPAYMDPSKASTKPVVNQTYTPEATQVLSEADKSKQHAKTDRPKTAAEQGFNKPNPAIERAKAKELAELGNARQRGERVVVEQETNVASQHKGKWFTALKKELEAKGIDAKRINYEASRLTKEEFIDWANYKLQN